MVVLKDDSYISPEQYLELELTSPVKHEYIDGEIFAMGGLVIPMPP